MSVTYTHGREFVVQIRPFLEARDVEGLLRHLKTYWPGDDVRGLLECGHTDAVKAALVCISLTGTSRDLPTVATLLSDDDCTVAGLAEYAMWAIWFRSGDSWSNRRIIRAVRLIGQDKLESAIRCLTRIIEHSPHFAEAYNQRAIAHFLKEDYAASIDDCLHTLQLNPWHFGATAGLGHCYAAEGRLEEALEMYRAALVLHPRLEGIRQSIQQIRAALGQIVLAPKPATKSKSSKAPNS